MVASHHVVIHRMESQVDQWKQAADPRAVFLSCYLLMTRNILAALEQDEFDDPAWVGGLMERFADYYFEALEAYDQSVASAPPVWQFAHNLGRAPQAAALQQLLAGVNAHINYDLVLTLDDMLRAEWETLSADQRQARYRDHCRVNGVIARTIDAVQDQVLEPRTPILALADELLGPVDELLVSRLITHWRESVWHNATRLLETPDAAGRRRLVAEVEQAALRIADRIA